MDDALKARFLQYLKDGDPEVGFELADPQVNYLLEFIEKEIAASR